MRVKHLGRVCAQHSFSDLVWFLELLWYLLTPAHKFCQQFWVHFLSKPSNSRSNWMKSVCLLSWQGYKVHVLVCLLYWFKVARSCFNCVILFSLSFCSSCLEESQATYDGTAYSGNRVICFRDVYHTSLFWLPWKWILVNPLIFSLCSSVLQTGNQDIHAQSHWMVYSPTQCS